MQIWPAIDLLSGKCVRLEQGDYARETVFSDDPVAVALQFQSQGAKHLHLVDLDGARDGKPTNFEVVRAIVEAVDMECELGGGVRSQETIETLLDTGLNRLVLGTSALKNADWFREMCRQFPGQLVLGIDARNGLVATDGWLETSDTPATTLADQFREVPLAAIVYTDIATDGMLAGPNVAAMAEMQKHVDTPVVASGGVTSASDVQQLAEAGLAAAIIGRALYAEKLTLPEALVAARTQANKEGIRSSSLGKKLPND
ncbi:MAG: 1-(5-phosphoribosyl)-5-[(5-phosphoribosylamino)methylideneamino]imidazole-4-carboxamide isomerase [Planctomycetes bacterium]|nr:1-(5-phosphoribosyl)-5-[(5-phosphoribosylamino)methylideneamino]imidazole-4-carboxamide isomerase [Planctomycetota bacterium]